MQRLNERIKIMRLVKIDDGQCGYAQNWIEHAAHFAHVRVISGRERDQAAQIISPRNYQIMLRNSINVRTIKPNDKIVWRGLAMEIVFIAFEGVRDAYVKIDCMEQKTFAEGVI